VTLILSEGVPMLLCGDELGHSQSGNNNTYCQDNELTWLNWEVAPEKQELLDFVRHVIRFHLDQPVFHRRRFFHGKSLRGEQAQEIIWLTPTGQEMSDEAWRTPHTRCLGVHLVGGRIDVDEYGEPIIGDHVLMLFNADHASTIPFTLPPVASGQFWERVVDTALPAGGMNEPEEVRGSTYDLQKCSVAVFRSPVPDEAIAGEAKSEEVVAKTIQ
jgi:isoamylase